MSAFGGKADIAAKQLIRDEARRIAANIAKLRELGAPESFAEHLGCRPAKWVRVQLPQQAVDFHIPDEITNDFDLRYSVVRNL